MENKGADGLPKPGFYRQGATIQFRRSHIDGSVFQCKWVVYAKRPFGGPQAVLAYLSRRYLLHVLPSGFHRIRHYGLLAKANRKHDIPVVRRLLHQPPPTPPPTPATASITGTRDRH